MTANSPGEELHHALSEAESRLLHAGPGRGVEDPPLHQLELPHHEPLGLDVDHLGLAQPLQGGTWPELASLVEVDGKAEGVVLVVPTGLVSCQSK